MNLTLSRNAVLNHLERVSKRERLISLPTILQVEISSACNLACSICARSEFPYGPGHLSIDLFRSLAPVFPYVKKLILHGYGEPLAHPRFTEIMDIVGPFECEKSFYTNGTMLTGRRAEAVITGGMTEITVSIDSPDKAGFERIRKGASFDRVTGNVGRFITMRNGRGTRRTRVVLAAVAMRDNVDQLPGLVDLARELSADAVEINYLMAYKEELVGRSLFFDRPRANRAITEIAARARAAGIEARLPGLFSSEEGQKPPEPQKTCLRPYDFAYVGYDGNVRPCCFPLLYLGSIVDTDFRTIWNSQGYRGLRRSFAKGTPPEFCRMCLSGIYTHVDSEKCHISCRKE
jgi:MoaA/NifB/PqqE/SkfB family radical SAM enzyme